jgi:hypothetical protein
MTGTDLTPLAAEVAKYWRDWPQSRRDAVRDLSSFLADAIENLAFAVVREPRKGTCQTCGRVMTLTKSGVLRHHNGDMYVAGWRQVCEGVGELPAEAS